MSRIRISLAAFALAGILQAQEPIPAPAPTGGGGGGAAGGGGGSTQQPTSPAGGIGQGTSTQPGNTGRNPFPQGQDPNQRQQMPEMQRSIFLSGKVMLDDGTPPPEPVTIERVCNGNPRPEGYTDTKGRFSFELGRNSAMMADASTNSGSFDGIGNNSPGMPQARGAGNFPGQGIEQALMGCEIRASFPGFRSDVVNLAGRRLMDNPDVGTIVLHRMANVEGFTFSATSGLAPKEARKAFEKGRELIKKKKFVEAQREFEKATGLYEKYAAAWYDLGRIHESNQQTEPARKAYEASIAADKKYVNPYLNLSGIYAKEANWEKAAEFTGIALKLNPFEYPTMYFFNAVANLNLNKLEEAEKSAREARKLDAKNRMPKIDQVLGIILAQKRDLPGAKESLTAYLKSSPKAADADAVKKQLEQLDKLIAEGQ